MELVPRLPRRTAATFFVAFGTLVSSVDVAQPLADSWSLADSGEEASGAEPQRPAAAAAAARSLKRLPSCRVFAHDDSSPGDFLAMPSVEAPGPVREVWVPVVIAHPERARSAALVGEDFERGPPHPR